LIFADMEIVSQQKLVEQFSEQLQLIDTLAIR
jgi:hypothetical protein